MTNDNNVLILIFVYQCWLQYTLNNWENSVIILAWNGNMMKSVECSRPSDLWDIVNNRFQLSREM